MRSCIIHSKNCISIALCSAYVEFSQSDYGIVGSMLVTRHYYPLSGYARILTPSRVPSTPTCLILLAVQGDHQTYGQSPAATPIPIHPYRKKVFTVWQNRPAGNPSFAGLQRDKFRGVFGMGCYRFN